MLGALDLPPPALGQQKATKLPVQRLLLALAGALAFEALYLVVLSSGLAFAGAVLCTLLVAPLLVVTWRRVRRTWVRFAASVFAAWLVVGVAPVADFGLLAVAEGTGDPLNAQRIAEKGLALFVLEDIVARGLIFGAAGTLLFFWVWIPLGTVGFLLMRWAMREATPPATS